MLLLPHSLIKCSHVQLAKEVDIVGEDIADLALVRHIILFVAQQTLSYIL